MDIYSVGTMRQTARMSKSHPTLSTVARSVIGLLCIVMGFIASYVTTANITPIRNAISETATKSASLAASVGTTPVAAATPATQPPEDTVRTSIPPKPSQPATIAPTAICQTTPYTNQPTLDINPNREGLIKQIDSPVYYQTSSASTFADTYANLTACAKQQPGLNGYHAATSYTIKWAYAIQETSSQQCVIRRATIGIRVTQLLPDIETNSMSEPVRSQWRQKAAQLAAHENEHTAIDVGYAERLYESLRTLSGDCNSIGMVANAHIQSTLWAIETANIHLDERSAHGTL